MLTVDANGYLASIADPASETVRLQYVNDGLLSQFTDARNGVHTFSGVVPENVES